MHIISIVPVNKQGDWAVTLTVNADTPASITPIIHTESDRRIAIVRAVHLFDGLGTSGDLTVKIAVTDIGIRSGLWDALYADGHQNPDAVISGDIPLGAHDAVALLGGAR